VLLELPYRAGFAGAVHQSLQFVHSPYLMVLQHDWEFLRPTPHSIWQIVQIMQDNAQGKKEEEQSRIQAQRVTDEIGAAETEALLDPRSQREVASTPSPSPSPSPPAASSGDASPSAAASPSPPACAAASSPAAASSSPAAPAPLPINYVTFQSHTTLGYLQKDSHDVARHVGKHVHRLHHYPTHVEDDAVDCGEPGSDSAAAASCGLGPDPSCPDTSPIPLAPIYFWFDRNHLVRASYYRDLVFGSYRFMRSAAFIEDTFGQLQLNMLRGSYHGVKNHRKHPFEHYASFLYYPHQGQVCYVDHIHGRKWLSDAQREEQYALNDEARAKQAARRERKKQLERDTEEAASKAAEPIDHATAEEAGAAINALWI